jgi:hypothetical protein
MSAPNRKAEVEKAFAGLTIHPKTEADDGRRANLYAVGRYLNTLDAGQWGCLVKTDQGGKIPADILVWRDTREHFDVITGDGGPAWIAYGTVPKPEWVWRAIPDGPAPPSEPDPEPDMTCQAEDILKVLAPILANIDQRLAALESKPYPVPVVRFPVYTGTVKVPYLGTGDVTLEPQK